MLIIKVGCDVVTLNLLSTPGGGVIIKVDSYWKTKIFIVTKRELGN